jgi:hypothetical protein
MPSRTAEPGGFFLEIGKIRKFDPDSHDNYR